MGITHLQENLTIMDAPTTKFRKPKIILTLPALVTVTLFFIFSVTITGLSVYFFAPCPYFPKVEESTVIVFDKLSPIELTTLSVDSKEITTREDNNITTTPSTITSTATKKTKTDLYVRLPKSIHPHSYKISLIPFIQEGNFTFHGNIVILINVTENTDNITLHADDLIIDNVQVLDRQNKTFFIQRISSDKSRQFLIIYLVNPIEAGHQYYLRIKFRGILNDLLYGFYRSSYIVNNGTRWIAATQFQATEARKAFPCFDEPAMKAKFQINIARMENMSSISNMRKIGLPEPVLNLPGYVWDHYEESVPMSTYLIAFVVTDFNDISNGAFSIWTRPSAVSQAEYGLKIGPKILKYYEDFFDIKYPLPKVDMIGLPDFSAGAMENWGLITYRESLLLYDKTVSTKSSLQRIAHVIAHELAHQWFGNLVTPVWWSDLWLNEGFATYVEFLGADAVNPQLKELDQFIINELHGAFVLDALKSSHPISIKVNNPVEIIDIFDRISYSKGAAILRMMQHFLTMKVFRRGLNKYLSMRMYGNAEQDDLWGTLTEQSHIDNVLDKNLTIKEIMDTWTLQVGYPVVTVERNYNDALVCVKQERFLIQQDNSSFQEMTLWWVPITYTDKNAVLKSIWLNREPKMIISNLNTSYNDWLLINVNQTGYYRVNYDETNWNLIIGQLHKEKGHLVFDPKNRAQLLDDALNLASAGYIAYDLALNLTLYLTQEKEFVPWKAAFTNLDLLYERFIRTAHFDKYKAYMLKLINNVYKEIGFYEKEDEEQLLVYNRCDVYFRACKLGVRDCIINSVQQFESWRNSLNPDRHNSISVNNREIVYCTAISVGGQEEWDFAWQRYLNANVGNEKEILLMALGCSKETWILSRFLDWAITENSGIRKHNSPRVFAAVASNPVGQELAYRFLKTHWYRIRAYLGTNSMALSSIVRSCTVKFNTQLEVDDFESFVKSRYDEFGIALRTAEQSLEQGKANVEWMSKYFNNIVKWLSSLPT